MIKNKFAVLFDSFFISLLISFIFYIWLSKYIKNAFFCYFSCILILILLFVVIFNNSLKKYNIKKINIKDIKFSSICFNSLINLNENELKEFYKNLFNVKEVNKNVYTNNNNYFYINLQRYLTDNDFLIANQFYLETDKNLPLIFIGIGFTQEFNNLLSISTNNYRTYESVDVYNLMKIKNMYPPNIKNFNEDNFKIKLNKTKTKFLNSLTKNKFKNFFLSGLSLIFISIFIPYSIYYQIFGTIFLILSIICLFDKSKISKTDKLTLDSLIKKDADK